MAANVTRNNIPTLDPTLLERIGREGDIALQLINAEINRQALFIAYLDDFKLMMILTFAALPLVLLMRNPQRGNEGGVRPAIAD